MLKSADFVPLKARLLDLFMRQSILRARSFEVDFNLKRESPSHTYVLERDSFNLKLSRSNNQNVDDSFAARLGDFGPEAIPVVDRLIGTGREAGVGGILALCRMGPAAAGYANKVSIVPRATTRSSVNAEHLAAYITLLRFGRVDLVDGDPDAGSRVDAVKYNAARTSIDPGSAPGVCILNPGYPDLPDGAESRSK